MIPTWLQRHLADTAGAPLGARYAKPRLHTCGAWTLLGLDADTLAHTAHVDPTPLTTDGELTALLSGRRTYLLTRANGLGAGRLVLDDRDRWRTRGRPAGQAGTDYDVVPAHVCHRAFTGPLVTSSNLAPATSTAAARDQAPPY